MKLLKFLKPYFLGSLILLFLFPYSLIDARSSSEISEEINNQQQELKDKEAELNQLSQNIGVYESELNSASEGLPSLEAELKKIEEQIKYYELELDIYNQNKIIKELEKQQRELTRINSIKTNYMDWRVKDTDINKVLKENLDRKITEKYAQIILNKQNNDISFVSTEIAGLNTEIFNFEEKSKELDNLKKETETKKSELEAQIAYYSGALAYAGGQIGYLQGAITNIQGNILSLSEEQRVAILREEEILRLNQGTLGNTNCSGDANAPSGSLYLCGNGRDLVMGHGVGMSQYGAKGAAELGWSAEQILEFYYPGASLTSNSVSSEISVKYCQSNPALDPFQDGCNDGRAPVTERVSFDTYLAGLGEMPESWPIEARKAQMIAARTYAAKYTGNGNPNYPICLTTYCQVSYFKNGDTSELNIAQSTTGQVMMYGGDFIEALYSADNNQGNGTADYDTRFQTLDGNATSSRPYLTSVNDNQFAQVSRMYWDYYCQGSACGLWNWKTYSYSIADIEQMLYFNGLGQWMIGIGGLSSIGFERDPSLRVKKVYLYGLNGQSRVIGGWWFKYFWNEWVATRGTYDYIYSQTYYLNVN